MNAWEGEWMERRKTTDKQKSDSGGWIRTNDFQVMNPTSFDHCYIIAQNNVMFTASQKGLLLYQRKQLHPSLLQRRRASFNM